ncbi:hypothetical protein [Scytonema sp. HK-05]|uniref:hypothetical protein n=1 Tax=Scytonema sp. HK-05 TaxID=1137095 RepID=UPI0018EA0EDF|nr:hypothetical protein [Scytonema sp. HK-05]
MMNTTIAIEQQQSLNQDFNTCLNQNSFSVSNDIELDLESILVEEFEQGLPNDLESMV